MSPLDTLRPNYFIRKHGWAKVILVLLDFVAITLAAVTTYILHYYSGFDDYDVRHQSTEYLLRVGVLYASMPILFVILRQNLLYKHKVYSSRASQFALLLRSVLINSLMLIAVLFFVRQEWIMHSRANLILFSVTLLLYLSVLRIYLFRHLINPTLQNLELRRVLVVGSGAAARAMMDIPMTTSNVPFQIVGVVDLKPALHRSAAAKHAIAGIDEVDIDVPPDHDPIPTYLATIRQLVRDRRVDEVIIAEDALAYEDAVRIVQESREFGATVNLLSDHFRVIHERVIRSGTEFSNIAAAPVSSGLEGPYAQFLKRPIDILGALIALILLSPFLIVIALLVKLGSRGPLFYTTTVIGRKGHPFVWHKFRSMQMDRTEDAHREHVKQHIKLGSRPTGKLENDPRITWIGRWLRRHSLDELPQVWNVLKGDMSLIGPRPCLPYEYEQYEEWHKERFALRPGLTGLWQVSGRSSVSFNDMVILDLYYIHNVSLWLDAAIVFRTIGVVISGEGGG